MAAQQIIAALADLDADPTVDVIVIARGGGALEDLLPFSDEALVRAVYTTRTPSFRPSVMNVTIQFSISSPIYAHQRRPTRASSSSQTLPSSPKLSRQPEPDFARLLRDSSTSRWHTWLRSAPAR